MRETQAAHFITSTVVEWLPIFTTAACCDILLASLDFCRREKELRLFGWVIMDHHFHAVVDGPDLSRTIADLKKYTAKLLLEQLPREGRAWLVTELEFYRQRHKTHSQHQVWQEGFHPQAVFSDEVMEQKLDYLHANPVRAGKVASPEHWRYSSAHEWLPGATPVIRCDSWK